MSTPGLGLPNPPNYNNETHKHTVVIELPHMLSDFLGDDGALAVDVDITFPDSQLSLTWDFCLDSPSSVARSYTLQSTYFSRQSLAKQERCKRT